MAGELKSGFFIFDQQESTSLLAKEERPSLFKRIRQFLGSRYAMLALVFLMSGALIFYNTAALQFSGAAASGVNETTGTARQLTVPAPRGDIVDAAGLPLAYSRSINTILIAYAGLDAAMFNAMLLDLANFLDARGVQWDSALADYLALIDPQGNLIGEDDLAADGTPVFLKPEADILYWQTDSNLFNLKMGEQGQASTYASTLVKTDAEIFFDYLLYKCFAIENPLADGKLYSRAEAFKIMKLRYLILQNNWTFINGTPVEIARDVSDDVVYALNEQNYRFMGVITGKAYERAYTDAASSVSHVLGYVGNISAEQYKEMRALGYSIDAVIGQSGVELSAERYLSGQNGIKPYNIWTVAGENGAFYSENIGKDAIPGYNVRLTIDLALQQVAERSLERVITAIRDSPDNKNKGDADAGAVVMIDVRTGAILAMVSEPAFDPNDFILQASDNSAADRVSNYLHDNVNKPMWNRAMMEIYAPGSTFKPATTVAALQSGAITPNNSIIRCKGHEIIGDWPFHCLEKPVSGHGDLTLEKALATSCNMYFYNLGFRTGINQIDYWGQKLGLGEYTGIDLPGEAKGIRASRATKQLLRSNPSDQIWFPADTCQTAIGQFDNSFTILQLAVYTAALATGNKVTPHVIDEITRSDGVVVKQGTTDSTPIGIQASTLAAVKKGMLAVVSNKEGTAYRSFRDFPIKVAAKTGTAETGYEDVSSSNGLFICYAPADNPQVAIAQIVEKGAWGSNTIGIAKDLLAAYFNLDTTASADPAELPGLRGFADNRLSFGG